MARINLLHYLVVSYGLSLIGRSKLKTITYVILFAFRRRFIKMYVNNAPYYFWLVPKCRFEIGFVIRRKRRITKHYVPIFIIFLYLVHLVFLTTVKSLSQKLMEKSFTTFELQRESSSCSVS